MALSIRQFRFFMALSVCCCLAFLQTATAVSSPLTTTDVFGREVTFDKPPARVVCLVPAVSEMLLALGAGKAVVGTTEHDASLPWAEQKTLVGGFGAPEAEAIAALAPDLLIVASLHEEVKEHFRSGDTVLLQVETNSIGELYQHLRLLGRIFDRQTAAAEISGEIRGQFETVARKTAAIEEAEKKRVIRVMRAFPLWVPGDDSFQNEFIRAAGGIAPRFGRGGHFIEITLAEWQRFNPQVIYACGDKQVELKANLRRPGWREVDAVRRDRIYFFPCDLTCRASVHAGDLVESLSDRLYGD